jgi:hypothetical protein
MQSDKVHGLLLPRQQQQQHDFSSPAHQSLRLTTFSHCYLPACRCIVQHPHEAFGMVFNFDGVVADLPTIKREAWAMLAQQLELPLQQQMLQHPELQVCSGDHAVELLCSRRCSRGSQQRCTRASWSALFESSSAELQRLLCCFRVVGMCSCV